MVMTLLSPEAVHPDTQAVLLLCGSFVPAASSEVKPLSLTEYNALAQWLNRQDRRPADLLQVSDEPFPAGEPGLPPVERVRELLRRGMQMAAALERWERLGLWVVGRGEERYPVRLRQVLRSAAPALLYGAGDVSRLNRGGLAVVGSRDVDEEGLSFTRRVAEHCTAQDVQVISGGARGVDQTAVAAALEAGGGAVAVLADRLDRTATSRDAKQALREGLLTLVTPYEPEAGFTVGRAMGRNKHIYALADHALVVRFTTGKGGTWAGAEEQLRRNKSGPVRVPVFVRVADNPEDGWRRLRDKGARPFPEEEFWTGNVTEVLSRDEALVSEPSGVTPAPEAPIAPPAPDAGPTAAPEPPAQNEVIAPPCPEPVGTAPPVEAVSVAPTVAAVDSCYSLCLPLLLRRFRDEEVGKNDKKQLSELAGKLEILPAQLNKWIARAIVEGRVKTVKKKRKNVYVAVSRGEDTTLFERGGDAA